LGLGFITCKETDFSAKKELKLLVPNAMCKFEKAKIALMKPLIKLTIIAFLLLAIKLGFAQQINVEGLITRQSLNCQDIASSATQMIPALHQANQTDTLYALIAYWEENCGLPEPLLRFHILHQIEINNFSEDWLPDNILNVLRYYRYISGWEDPNYYFDNFDRQYYPIDPSYQVFSRLLAEHFQRYTDLKPIELFFLEYYAHEFDKAMARLSSGELKGTFVDSLFTLEKEVAKKVRKSFINIYGGVWKPNGQLSLLGSHPEFGFGIGFVQQRFLLEALVKVGFLPSPNYYEVVVGNMGYITKNFTNLHISGRLGMAAVDQNRHLLLLSVGIGYEGIQAFSTSEQEEQGLSRMISSPSISPGIEFRFPVGETSYLGLNLRYNFLNFVTRRNETPLKGNALLFGISLGFDSS
jgi:hypothetical protein